MTCAQKRAKFGLRQKSRDSAIFGQVIYYIPRFVSRTVSDFCIPILSRVRTERGEATYLRSVRSGARSGGSIQSRDLEPDSHRLAPPGLGRAPHRPASPPGRASA